MGQLVEHSAYEIVYTITDWYDGARAGIANFEGKPHYYQCEVDFGPDENYLLSPLDNETFRLAIESWKIWLRWEAAFDKGFATLETHPALPDDNIRYQELTKLLDKMLIINPKITIRAQAIFIHGKDTLVKWIA